MKTLAELAATLGTTELEKVLFDLVGDVGEGFCDLMGWRCGVLGGGVGVLVLGGGRGGLAVLVQVGLSHILGLLC